MKKILILGLILMTSFMFMVVGSVSAASLDLCQKDPITWQCTEGATATLKYNKIGPEFEYKLTVDQTFDKDYVLIYYADQDPRFETWGGNPALYLGTLEAGEDTLTGSVDTGSLPFEDDWNIDCDGGDNYCDNEFDNYKTCYGAKIWLVPASDYDKTGKTIYPHWNPDDYLFETDLINYVDNNENPTEGTKASWLRDNDVPGKGIAHAPGLQKPKPNNNFAKGTANKK